MWCTGNPKSVKEKETITIMQYLKDSSHLVQFHYLLFRIYLGPTTCHARHFARHWEPKDE